MIRAYALEALTVALQKAREFAVAAGLGEHFVSEIDHLAATVEHNKENTDDPQD